MLNHAQAVREIIEESKGDKRLAWLHDQGILSKSVRLDIPLRDGSETLHLLRWLAQELPAICVRIERELTNEEQLTVAQQWLKIAAGKVKRKDRK